MEVDQQAQGVPDGWEVVQAPQSAAPKPAAWTEAHPTIAAVTKSALSALPAAGAVMGGVVGAPAAAMSSPLGAPFVEAGAVGLGAGAGRGLRDLIAEGIGLEPKSSVVSKATRIGTDTAEAGAAQALLPGLLEALKTPGATVREALTTFEKHLPKALKIFVPDFSSLAKDVAEKPASSLVRPAWQTWAEYAKTMTPSPTPTKTAVSALDFLRVKQLMEQGIPQGEAFATVMNLKVKGK